MPFCQVSKLQILLSTLAEKWLYIRFFGIKNIKNIGEEGSPALLDNITMCGRVCDRQADTLKFFLKRIR
jgi:hypothetical protein